MDARPTPSGYDEWERQVPQALREDSLWRVQAYRLALFASDLAVTDARRLWQDRRGRALADQLYRAVASVSANVAEGYSRGFGKERAHFYEYALGSAREGRDWYYKARHALEKETITTRFELLNSIIRLLLRMIDDQRARCVREPTAHYRSEEAEPPQSDQG